MDVAFDRKPSPLEGVSFANQNLTPPSNLYVGKDDVLFVTTYSSASGLRVDVRGRHLLANGRMVTMEFSNAPASDRSAVTQLYALGEGYLLNLGIFLGAGTCQRGQCYVVVGLAQGKESSNVKHTIIAQGYVASGINQSWPGNRLEHPLEGQGWIHKITGTDQAAGFDVAETVPAGARWRLMGLKASLVTSATVNNRRVRFYYYNSSVLGIILLPASITQAASLTYGYSAAPGMAYESAPDITAVQVGIPNGIFLTAFAAYGTNTLLLDGADNWGAPQTYVEEWIEP